MRIVILFRKVDAQVFYQMSKAERLLFSNVGFPAVTRAVAPTGIERGNSREIR